MIKTLRNTNLQIWINHLRFGIPAAVFIHTLVQFLWDTSIFGFLKDIGS